MPEEETKKRRGLSGLFEHLNELLDVVADLQEGKELNRSGEIRSRSGKVSGLYGLRIRSGLESEGAGPVFEHFGDIGSRGGRATVNDEREPVVDIFEEDNKITVVAEIPGAQPDNIEVTIENRQTLVLTACSRERKYRKELNLSHPVLEKPLQSSYLNGIYSVILLKEADPALN
jgi:HSP20 family protein